MLVQQSHEGKQRRLFTKAEKKKNILYEHTFLQKAADCLEAWELVSRLHVGVNVNPHLL
jgi:hypothetical protein